MLDYKISIDSDRLTKLMLSSTPRSKIILQFPEGLSGKFIVESGIKDIIDKVEENQGERTVYLTGDPCYGYCDLPITSASNLGADMIIHFGHNDFGFPTPAGPPVHFFEVDYRINLDEKIEEYAKETDWQSVGLVTTVQHLKQLEEWRNRLFVHRKELTVVIPGNGQVLGCNYSNPMQVAKQVDGFLVIAGGNFHAKQVPVMTGKPCIRLDPFTGELKLFDNTFINDYLKKRYAAIMKASKAKNVGIIISLKSGQFRKNEINESVARYKERKVSFRTYQFPVNQVIPEILDNYSWIDAWAVDRCPRLALDDSLRFMKPVLTFSELDVIAGIKTWNDLLPSGMRP
ncbi:MAG: diphthamide biosynthesis enzyme Dph2 [Candidatus Odinarchaeota archaeon]